MTLPLVAGLLLPPGKVLYKSATATRRHLATLLIRMQSANICGYVSLTAADCEGAVLLLNSQPCCATVLDIGDTDPRYGSDAFDRLCRAADNAMNCGLTLHRLDERQAQALAALFQRPSLICSIDSAADARFLMEIVHGCRLWGCVQFHSGGETVVAMVRDGQVLGVYDVQSEHVQKTLASATTTMMAEQASQVALYPQSTRVPSSLMSIPASSLLSTPELRAQSATLQDTLPELSQLSAAAATATTPNSGDTDSATTSASPQLPVRDPASTMSLAPGDAVLPTPITATTSVKQVQRPEPQPVLAPTVAVASTALDLGKDEFAASQLLCLLAALDRRWRQAKAKGLAQPATLAALAWMLTQTTAKVEVVRIQDDQAVPDTAQLASLVQDLRDRYPAVLALTVDGRKIDAGKLIAHHRRLTRRASAEQIAASSEALLMGMRIELEQIAAEMRAPGIRRRMREICSVYLTEVEQDLSCVGATRGAVLA